MFNKSIRYIFILLAVELTFLTSDICRGEGAKVRNIVVAAISDTGKETTKGEEEDGISTSRYHLTGIGGKIKERIHSIKKEFLMFADITVYGTYSDMRDKSQIKGGKIDVILAPTINLNDRFFLILLNSDSFRRSKQVYAQDRGPYLASESAAYNLNPMIKYVLTERLSINPSYVYTDFRLRQNRTEKWGDGLYNYRDKGFGLDLNYIISRKEKGQKSARIGFQYYRRRYPNFRSLLSIAGKGNLEEKEKDYAGTLIKVIYGKQRLEGLSYEGSFMYLKKNYLDKRIENVSGERDTGKQRDETYTLGLNLDYSKEGGYRYKLNSAFSLNLSNQNLAEGSFPNVIFTPDYYSYKSATINPVISYIYTLSNGKKLTTNFSYSLTLQRYMGREAKDSDGNKKGKREFDRTHIYSISTVYNINKHLNVGAIVELQRALSNNDYEATYLYSYRILNLSAGFSFHY